MKNYNVLIDGYNLRLLKGSGIKNYTISLINAVKEDIDISLLFDYKLTEPQKVSFIENYYRGSNSNNKKLNLIKNIIKYFLAEKEYIFFFKENEILDHENNYLNNHQIFNIENLFKIEEMASRFSQNINLSFNSKIDIFHSTYFLNINVKKAKRTTTIHDLIPLKLPHTTLDDKKVFYNKVKNAIKTSDKIITISEYSKKDILENFDVAEDKIVNCYQSYHLPPLLAKNALKVDKFDLQKEDYFLFVGNIEPKKNVGRLIQAFLNLDTDKKLVIVGRKAWLWEELLRGSEKAIKKKKIILLDYVTREDLIALYQNAFAFVFPSLYEGFGLPPLEAMACKCPVITSNVTSLPEVCEDAAIYCDPYSIFSIQNALEKMLNLLVEEKSSLIKKGLKRVEFFSTERFRKSVLKVYESVL